MIVDYSAHTSISSTPGIVYSSYNSATGTGYFFAYSSAASPTRSVSYNSIEKFNITGTQYADDIKGGNSNDTLTGGDGNDTIYGEAGTDSLFGGNGNDNLGGSGIGVYDGGSGDDRATINIAASTTDTLVDIVTDITNYGLQLVSIESLSITSGSGNDTINGDTLSDYINTGAGDDIINIGASGNDDVLAGNGTDTLIVDYSAHTSTSSVPGIVYNNYNSLTGTGYFIAYSSAATTTRSVSYNSIEKFNIIGTQYADDIKGGNNNDTLIGGNGNDTITGGGGNDYLNGGLGNDRVDGGDGNDVLDGNFDTIGLDTFVGGAGDDVYGIYSSATVIIENANEGIDTVWTGVNYTLTSNIENIYLVGSINSTGDNGDNLIVGYGSGDNNIYGLGGNDTLDGGLGNDYLSGGLGNDLVNGGDGNDLLDGSGDSTGLDTFVGGLGDDAYGIYNSSTVIIENAGGGNDTVWTGVNYALATNVENLYLVGAINGSGNNGDNLIVGYGSGDNNIYGLGGNDTLDGGLDNDYLNGGLGNDLVNGGDGNDILDGSGDSTGLDTFAGGAGDDAYGIYNSSTVIIENASGGNDTVWTGVNYALAANIENLYLVGNTNGTGNSGSNNIYGYGMGDNLIDGGGGIDNLFGGAGNDTFVLSKTSADNIGDFGVGNDRLQISASDFGGGLIANVALISGQLRVGTTDIADTIVQRFIYNTTNGNLFFDADGSAGSSAAIKIANLSGVSSLGVNSFSVV